MAKRKKHIIISVFMLALSSYFVFSVIGEVQTMFAYNKNIDSMKHEQQELLDKKEDLNEEKKNLNDVNYIIRYATGKYLATKDAGDQVFKLPDGEE